jgi:hydrogenase maturation protein HypF
MKQRLKINVRGIVQGVGFRPYIYRLAHRFGLGGSILNSESGVTIEIEGMASDIEEFLSALPLEAPILARILEMETFEVARKEQSEFLILESTRAHSASTLVSPDIATCDDCVREMFDPSNRRYLYPFINCTNCGPRFTIVRSVPYDRKQTSMAAFSMCAQCQADYDDPLDRRFHAQPNACWDCGPQVELFPAGWKQNAILETVRLLKNGSIVAVKGLGGFHLAVDAHNADAVHELRRRKGRGDKPFAVMVANLSAARLLCVVTNSEAELLLSPQHPIVLLNKRSAKFDALAPDGNHLGLFLPYTPLHHLLVGDNGLPALVMTSANLSEEPIAIDNHEAIARLKGVADFFLLHNREILLRCDDSVMRSIDGRPQFARRSRGFVPSPIVLQEKLPNILAVGGDLKNVICMSRGRYAFPGQHIGDMENLSAYDFFLESIHHFEQILEVHPEVIAHDLHPGYLSTQWAKAQSGISLVGVQHHHAHIASCMAENQLSGKVIGVALDGTGFGTDGHVWGGELLIADLKTFERAAHLACTPMPGGEKCIHEPWRMAVANLWQTFCETWRDHAPPSLFSEIPAADVRIVEQMLHSATHSPLTSSCGRLFDAVSALVCGRTHVSYEAQAAIVLEACCDPQTNVGAYPLDIIEGACLQIDTRPLFTALTTDLKNHVEPGTMSRRFHEGLMNALAEVVHRVSKIHKLNRVCLSGGSFQNTILAHGMKARLEAAGLRVFIQTLVPAGDGGLSLGQLIIAANQDKSS